MARGSPPPFTPNAIRNFYFLTLPLYDIGMSSANVRDLSRVVWANMCLHLQLLLHRPTLPWRHLTQCCQPLERHLALAEVPRRRGRPSPRRAPSTSPLGNKSFWKAEKFLNSNHLTVVSDGGCWLAGSQCPEKEKQGCSHCCTWHGKYGQYQEGCGEDCSQYVCRKGVSILDVIAPSHFNLA